MIILGIETSCDETAVSVVEGNGSLETPIFRVLGSAIQSQVDLHRAFGGVVPGLAKREHQRNLLPVLAESLFEAGLISEETLKILNENLIADTDRQEEIDRIWQKTFEGVANPGIDLIAVTVGPGLEPALWTGITFAKILGQKWQIPVHGTNHMEGHIASVLFNKTEGSSNREIKFPAIALLISGGHTELVLLENWLSKTKIGETLDDAVGEAYDKVARMLDLPYPGGPQISALAEKARDLNIELDRKLPRPMIHSKDFNFSFSGLKTAVLYYLRKTSPPSIDSNNSRLVTAPLPLPRGGGKVIISEKEKLAIAREFEDAVTEVLISKTRSAIEKHNPHTLIIGGGVIANHNIRKNILELENYYPDLKALVPTKDLATDNATMIAIAGYLEKISGQSGAALRADGNLEID